MNTRSVRAATVDGTGVEVVAARDRTAFAASSLDRGVVVNRRVAARVEAFDEERAEYLRASGHPIVRGGSVDIAPHRGAPGYRHRRTSDVCTAGRGLRRRSEDDPSRRVEGSSDEEVERRARCGVDIDRQLAAVRDVPIDVERCAAMSGDRERTTARYLCEEEVATRQVDTRSRRARRGRGSETYRAVVVCGPAMRRHRRGNRDEVCAIARRFD